MAHWRSMVGQRTQFDVADLGGKELLVQIESAKPGEMDGFLSGRKSKTPCVQVKLFGYQRPLGCKPTLCKSITSIVGTGEITEWAGHWIWLYTELVRDPQGGEGAKCEAVRIRPNKPTTTEIDRVLAARGSKAAPPATVTRDEAADQRLVGKVCAELEATKGAAEANAVIEKYREEMRPLPERLQAIVKSTWRTQLAAFATPSPEGEPDAA